MALTINAVLLGSAQNKTGAASVAFTTGASVTADTEWAMAFIAKDNTGTASGDNSEVTSVADTRGNIWTKCKEMTNAAAAAGAATISAWVCVPTTTIQSGDSITFNFASCAAKCAWALKGTKAAGTTLSVGASGTAEADGASPGAALSLTPPDNREWLFVRAEAIEADTSSAGWNASTASWTRMGSGTGTTGGGAATNMSGAAEGIVITTGAQQTSDPTNFAVTGDNANIIFCINEVTPVVTLFFDRPAYLNYMRN